MRHLFCRTWNSILARYIPVHTISHYSHKSYNLRVVTRMDCVKMKFFTLDGPKNGTCTVYLVDLYANFMELVHILLDNGEIFQKLNTKLRDRPHSHQVRLYTGRQCLHTNGRGFSLEVTQWKLGYCVLCNKLELMHGGCFWFRLDEEMQRQVDMRKSVASEKYLGELKMSVDP